MNRWSEQLFETSEQQPDEGGDRSWGLLVGVWLPVAIALGRGAELAWLAMSGREGAARLQEWCRSIGYELDGSRAVGQSDIELRGFVLRGAIEETFNIKGTWYES